MPYDDETGHSYFETDEDAECWLNLYTPEAYYYASPADPHPGTIPINNPMPDDDTPFIPQNPSPEFPLCPQCNDHHCANAICFTTFEENLAVPLRDAGASIYKEGDVTDLAIKHALTNISPGDLQLESIGTMPITNAPTVVEYITHLLNA
jgi:hypothetical protein